MAAEGGAPICFILTSRRVVSSLRENDGVLQIVAPINTGCTASIRYASAYVVGTGH